MALSVAIMAHPRRKEWAEQLSCQLDAPIVWDRYNDRIETGLRSIQAYDLAATHHVVIQDDALVCRDILEGLELAVKVSQDRIVGLYVGKGRPVSHWTIARVAREAKRHQVSWVQFRGPIWGPGMVLPVSRIDEIIASYQHDPLKNYDARVENAARRRKIEWWYTWPSLVDHRPGHSNPSLVPGRTGTDRTAFRFLGCDESALTIDWSAGIYTAP